MGYNASNESNFIRCYARAGPFREYHTLEARELTRQPGVGLQREPGERGLALTTQPSQEF